jgi:hypothetical protein
MFLAASCRRTYARRHGLPGFLPKHVLNGPGLPLSRLLFDEHFGEQHELADELAERI